LTSSQAIRILCTQWKVGFWNWT